MERGVRLQLRVHPELGGEGGATHKGAAKGRGRLTR